nr:hypothetical protein [Deltaproteobacteria bacterium]
MTKRKPTEQTTAASMKELALGLAVALAKGRAELDALLERIDASPGGSDGDWDARWEAVQRVIEGDAPVRLGQDAGFCALRGEPRWATPGGGCFRGGLRPRGPLAARWRRPRRAASPAIDRPAVAGRGRTGLASWAAKKLVGGAERRGWGAGPVSRRGWAGAIPWEACARWARCWRR